MKEEIVMDNMNGEEKKKIRREKEKREEEVGGEKERMLERIGDEVIRMVEVEIDEKIMEEIEILRKVDGVGRGEEDRDEWILKWIGKF